LKVEYKNIINCSGRYLPPMIKDRMARMSLIGSPARHLSSLLFLLLIILPAFAGSAQIPKEKTAVPALQSTGIDLTTEERAWLQSNPVIRLSYDPSFAPYEWIDERGRYVGIAADYLDLIGHRLGTAIEVLPQIASWSEALERAKAGEAHGLTLLTPSPERSEYLYFTEPYVNYPWVIVTQEDYPFIGGLADLTGKRVAVPKGYVTQEILARDYPSLKLAPYETVFDSLQAVMTGQVEASVNSMATSAFYIRKHGLTNLKIAAPTGIETEGMGFGVVKSQPLLVGILQKALDTISEEERLAIAQKWVALEYKNGFDYSLLWQVLAGAVLLLLAFGYWNWRLRREVAARKRTEIALQQSERRLQLVVDTVPVVLVLKDRKGRYLLVNTNFEQATGVKREQALGKVDAEIFPSSVAESIRDFDEKIMATGRESLQQEEIPYPDGKIHTYFSRKVPLFDEEGKVTGLVLAALDISEQKAVEQELLLAKEAAETANRAKSLFLANISHELRTPLNAILGFSEMLGRDRQTNACQREKVGIINRSGEHLLNMINDVLDLSKIEAGHVELERVAFDLPLMLKDMGHMFDLRAENAGLYFNLELDAALVKHVKTDVVKLRQVLINLLGNAVTFTLKGGVALRARTLSTAEDPLTVTLQIEVEDSGIGIAPEQRERIFDPFVQVGPARKDLKGSGLGLAISKSFIELLGGEIIVTSTPGQGSLFHVELPVTLAKDSEFAGIYANKPAVLGIEKGQPQWRILVVEDNRDSRILLSSLLLEAGFLIKEAENGEEAIGLFEQWQPHFICMDMRMPVMDGYKATAKIRSLPGGDRVKIVAITASALKEQRKRIIEAGCDDVVLKPYKSHEIFDTMAHQLGVRYTYEEERTRALSKTANMLTAGMMVDLSSERRQALRASAHRLDISATGELIEGIRSEHPEIASGLQLLLGEFRFERILELLKGRQ